MQESPIGAVKGITAFAGIIMPEAAQRSMKFLYINLPKFVKLRKVIKTFIGMTTFGLSTQPVKLVATDEKLTKLFAIIFL